MSNPTLSEPLLSSSIDSDVRMPLFHEAPAVPSVPLSAPSSLPALSLHSTVVSDSVPPSSSSPPASSDPRRLSIDPVMNKLGESTAGETVDISSALAERIQTAENPNREGWDEAKQRWTPYLTNSRGVSETVIGWGHRLSINELPLAAKGMMDEQIERYFESDLAAAVESATKVKGFDQLSMPARESLIELFFTLGSRLSVTHPLINDHLSNGELSGASNALLQSDWARAAPQRAQLLAERLNSHDPSSSRKRRASLHSADLNTREVPDRFRIHDPDYDKGRNDSDKMESGKEKSRAPAPLFPMNSVESAYDFATINPDSAKNANLALKDEATVEVTTGQTIQ